MRNVGCVGRVTSYQEVDHARRVITLTGIMRYDILDEAVTDLPYRVMSVSYDRYAADLNEGLGEEQVDRTNLLRVLRSYLDANKLEADWAAIQRASSEFLINALCVMCPYGPGREAGAARGRRFEVPRRRAGGARRDGARLERQQRHDAAIAVQEMRCMSRHEQDARPTASIRSCSRFSSARSPKRRSQYDAAAQELISRAAGLAYPIRDGVPLMTVEVRAPPRRRPGGK